MKKIFGLVGIVFISSSLIAVEQDSSQRFTIVGEYFTPPGDYVPELNKSPKIDHELDWANASVVVSHQITDLNGESKIVELASGNFVDDKVTLIGEINKPTDVKVVLKVGQATSLSLSVVIVPEGEIVQFALMDYRGSQPNQLVLVGASKSVLHPSAKFSVSGTFEPREGKDTEKFLFAKLTSEEYHGDGRLNKLNFGTVLLRNNKFLIEAEVNEPKVAKLEISAGTSVVMRWYVVIEPNVEITVGRQDNLDELWFVASSDAGRHAKLLNSWQLEDEFVSANNAMLLESKKDSHVTKTGRVSDEFFELFKKSEEIKRKNLKNLAWESKDPLDSLLALELARKILVPGTLDYNDIIGMYDKLATLLDPDLVSRRVTPARNRIAAFLRRSKNATELGLGETVPEFKLANLDGETISLTQITDDNELVLIDFWAVWCAPCIAAFDPLKNLRELYRDRGFEIVSISVDTSFEEWEEISTKYELPWIDLGAPGDLLGSTAVAYGVQGLPTTYLVDTDRNIVRKNIKPNELSEALEEHFRSSQSQD